MMSRSAVVAEYGVSARDIKAEFFQELPPTANNNSPFGGEDHIAGYAPLALVAENGSNSLELYWVHGNHLGVPIMTTNAQGQVVTPSNDFLRPGFPGQSQVLADLYYNRARDYDPLTGRYIQADPIGLAGDLNPYVYANADPMNMIDPTGEVAWFAVPIGFAALEFGTQAYNLWANGCDPFNLSNYSYGRIGFAFVTSLGGGGLASGGARLFLGRASTVTKGRIGEVFARTSLRFRGRPIVGRTGNNAPRARDVPGLAGLTGRARNAKPDFSYTGRDGRTHVLEAKFSLRPPRSRTAGLTAAQRQLRNQLGDRFQIYRVTGQNVTNAAGIVGSGTIGLTGQ